jgi:cysteine-rich repeat protein
MSAMRAVYASGRVFVIVAMVNTACGDAQQCETDACGSSTETDTDADTDTDAETDTGTDTGSDDVCGDGMLGPGESCDDVNTSNTDACLNTCQLASCGDGYVYTNVEECDDGNTADDDDCTAACTAAVCGDGIVWTGMEGCDDGNDDDADACPGSCQPASCGDGYLQDGVEQCDDGNPDDTDECLSDCTLSLLPMVGDACDVNFLFQCVPAPEGNAGTPLLCQQGVLTETSAFDEACFGLCPQGSSPPVDACGGFGEYAICMCELDVPQPCEAVQLGCEGDQPTLCHEGQAVLGWCPACAMQDGYYACNW